MDVKPLTINDVLEVMSEEEKEEILRPDFKVPLQYFLTGYNRNPILPQAAVLQKCSNYVRRRLSVKHAVARNPEILRNEIDSPIIIIGLLRSGTTFLYRLLLSDPQFIGPLHWEMTEPVPPGRPENWRECDRYKNASEDPEWAPLLTGAFDAPHYMRPDLPYECYMILRNYFIDFIDPIVNEKMTELRHFLYNTPEDHAANAYEFFKMCLQCLFYGNLQQGTRVLLKSPIHTLYLETLGKTFPNARFIFPYRNAKTMMSSYSALAALGSKIMFDSDDLVGIGKRSTEFFKNSSQRAVNYLKQLPKDKYIAVPYTEMVKNPIGTVQQIYSHFNLDLKAETVEKMQVYLKENYQHKHGKHEYSPEDYGITDEVVKENMKEYLEYFGNGPEKLL